MKRVLHTADSRGHANHGWLDSHHTFSFAGYWNPDRMGFGALRVLNDDIIAPGAGFDTHPHDNMEIISIPLSGALAHRDSMNHETVIRSGEIQVMSAGTGIYHSEYNSSDAEAGSFLQIWVLPRERGVSPRYAQMTIDADRTANKLYQMVSPNPEDDGLWIHQDAWFYMGTFSEGFSETYRLHDARNGIYLFCIDGEIDTTGVTIGPRDGLALTDVTTVDMKAVNPSRVLLMEVPMVPEKTSGN